MPAKFELAIPVIIAHEVLPGSRDGSYTKTPGDKGGATKWGITAHTLGRWRKLGRDATDDEVKGLGRDEALVIYRALYWDLFRCGELDDQVVATKVFDMGVNMRVDVVGKILQAAANRCQEEVLEVDGVVGSKTIAAANRSDPGELVTEMVHLQTEHYLAICQEDPTQERFKKDWVSRARWPYEAV